MKRQWNRKKGRFVLEASILVPMICILLVYLVFRQRLVSFFLFMAALSLGTYSRDHGLLLPYQKTGWLPLASLSALGNLRRLSEFRCVFIELNFVIMLLKCNYIVNNRHCQRSHK